MYGATISFASAMPPPEASGSASSSAAGSVSPPAGSSVSASLVELDELLLLPPPQAARARARAKTRSARIALLLNVTDDISLLRCESVALPSADRADSFYLCTNAAESYQKFHGVSSFGKRIIHIASSTRCVYSDRNIAHSH